MPQLSNGQNASLVLAPGESYTISTTGRATVKGVYGAPSITTTLTANFAKFGPYGVPAKLDIACSAGVASYTLDQFQGVPALVTTDVTGEMEIQAGGEAFPLNDSSKIALPTGALSPTLSASLCVPLSVGIDGLVYGSTGLGSRTLTRSNDAFVSQDDGAVLPSVGTLIAVHATQEGFMAVTSAEELFGSPGSNSQYAAGAELWFSKSWKTGWAKVRDIGRTQGLAIGRPVYSKTQGGTIITVGEYSQTAGQTHKLWLSKNGGQSWAEIQALVANNATKNNHYHGSGFDEKTGRIYVSHGDYENAWFGYTQDFGATWVPVPAAGMPPDSLTTFHQPVVCDACCAGILTTPDSSTGKAGVWMVGRTDGFAIPAFSLSEDPANQYAESPIAADGDYVRYTVNPMRGTRLSNKVYVLATGDGGRNWFKVYEGAQGATQWYQRGIIGPDKNGKLYIHCRDNATNQLYIADQLAWAKVPPEYVRATGGALEDMLVAAGLLKADTPIPFDTQGAPITAHSLNLTGAGATLKIGGASGVGAIDTPSTITALRQLFNGNRILEYTATAGYGQIEYTMPITYLKFTGATGGYIATQPSQKIAFWGATPVVRPTGTPAAATDLATVISLANDLRTKLTTIGLIS